MGVGGGRDGPANEAGEHTGGGEEEKLSATNPLNKEAGTNSADAVVDS